MIEKMKSARDNKEFRAARDNKEFRAAILTDLSKFWRICHVVLIAKLNAYGFDQNPLKLMYDYLSDRSQKTKVGSSFSAYLHIIYGTPQGSILGPLLFNIDLCDLFFESYSSDFTNFADDYTPYECGPLLYEVMKWTWNKYKKNVWMVQFQQFKSKCFQMSFASYSLLNCSSKY